MMQEPRTQLNGRTSEREKERKTVRMVFGIMERCFYVERTPMFFRDHGKMLCRGENTNGFSGPWKDAWTWREHRWVVANLQLWAVRLCSCGIRNLRILKINEVCNKSLLLKLNKQGNIIDKYFFNYL
jgi:hypothetical protein